MKAASTLAYWTHCYHVTAVANLRGIQRTRMLFPAAILFGEGRDAQTRCRRIHDVHLRFDGEDVLVRNQAPLDPYQIDLGTETFEEYVANLNSHVFFWPGDHENPTPDGIKMSRNTEVESAIIRIPIESLLKANADSAIFVSTCNSGAAWLDEGVKSRRGTNVFKPVETFSMHANQIAEILFRGPVALPDHCQYRAGMSEDWSLLFARAPEGAPR